MYGRVPVADSVEMSGSAWGVWCALCAFATWQVHRRKIIRSKPQSCFPSISSIAARAHISESTAKRAIRELEALGMVRVVPRFAPTDEGPQKERMSNFYDLFPLANAPKVPEKPIDPEELKAMMSDFVAQLERGEVGLKNTAPRIVHS